MKALYRPGHAKMCLMPCEQHRCCLDSIICIFAISKVSRFWLASVAEQAGSNLTWSKIPKGMFSCDVAHIIKDLQALHDTPHCAYFCCSACFDMKCDIGCIQISWNNLQDCLV